MNPSRGLAWPGLAELSETLCFLFMHSPSFSAFLSFSCLYKNGKLFLFLLLF